MNAGIAVWSKRSIQMRLFLMHEKLNDVITDDISVLQKKNLEL